MSDGRIAAAVDRTMTTVTTYNRAVILVMLVATALVVPGVLQLEMEGNNGLDVEEQTTVAEKADYIQENYGEDNENEPTTATRSVYVRADNALSQTVMLDALRYQRDVIGASAVSDRLAENGITGPPTLVATELADTENPTIEEQIAALESASETEFQAALQAAFAQDREALQFLPRSFSPETGTAESFRMSFEFTVDQNADANDLAGPSVPTAVTETLYGATQDRSTDAVEYFTIGDAARESWTQQRQSDLIELIVVPALVLILAVLAFTYRDIVDVVVGFVGVLLSVLWMFGVLGWLGVPAGLAVVIGPVLVIALSIDFGLHVFMRYREERGPEEAIQPAMDRATSSVVVAFLLVTVTAAIGFLSNLISPVAIVRDLGIAITLGVLSSFLIFVTLVPALKVSIDGLLERFGLDRRKTALGKGRFLRPVLTVGVRLARRAAPVVVVVALVGGLAGGVAVTQVDQQGVQTDFEVAEWKTELPGPLAWESADLPFQTNLEYVQTEFQRSGGGSLTQMLIEGDPTAPETLERVSVGTDAAADTDVAFEQGGQVRVISPLSTMQQVAQRDEQFASVFAEADTDGDGVPDRNVAAVYDALFEAAPDDASRVIERTDGEYRSLRVLVPVQSDADRGDRGDAMRAVADEMETDGVTVTAVGSATLTNAELGVLADGILRTLVLALAVIGALLTAVYRLEYGSATLGVVTVVPVALTVGLVFGSMFVFGVPLTFVTALLLSIAVGLGVDYSIHVSDRYAQEIADGVDSLTALETAATGTGGALLGSMLTSGIAFATMLLHPSPQLRSFGALVVFALSLAFLLSVVVLPSMLHLWNSRVRSTPAPEGPAVASDD